MGIHSRARPTIACLLVFIFIQYYIRAVLDYLATGAALAAGMHLQIKGYSSFANLVSKPLLLLTN